MSKATAVVVEQGGTLRIYQFPSLEREEYKAVYDATERLAGVMAVGGSYGEDRASLRVYVSSEFEWRRVDSQVMAMIQSRLPGEVPVRRQALRAN